ncbi:MAG TPA: FHA domain-containing protein [Dokdonella sp.]|nr:FHA domain-containing protein [Dokdonella sp.]
MGEVTWIEVVPRHREHALRQRVDADSLTLGRAWDNDIVLDDPHVAAHHLRLARDEAGAWTAHDLGSVNGLHVEGERGRRDRVALAPHVTLQVGQCLVRLHRGDEDVAPEVPLQRRSPWPAALALVALVVLVALLEQWRGETGEPKLIRYVTGSLALATLLSLWTAAWALVSRLFSGHARFGAHLLVAAAGVLAYSLYDPLCEFLAFALSWPRLELYAWAGAWIALAATCFAHLRVVGSGHLRLKAIVVAALATLAIATQSFTIADRNANWGQAVVLPRLAPPWLRLAPQRTPDAFFAGAAQLKPRLDDARSEEPAGDDAGAMTLD